MRKCKTYCYRVTVTEAYKEGYQAGYHGNMNNPYFLGSKESQEWNLGYEEARIDMAAGR